MTIGCDGEKALWISTESDDLVGPSNSDFDLISAIRNKIGALPVEVSTRWIKGHQDKFAIYDKPLDLWARLNIWCDALSKRH